MENNVLFLTPEELAERYRIPKATIYAWNSHGVGPRYIKLGKHIRYRMADVIEWEESNVVEGCEQSVSDDGNSVSGSVKRRSRRCKENSSKYKGVSNTPYGWRARIQEPKRSDNTHPKLLVIGTFDSEEEAARAYDETARKIRGGNCTLNFPNPGERSALTGEIIPLESEAA